LILCNISNHIANLCFCGASRGWCLVDPQPCSVFCVATTSLKSITVVSSHQPLHHSAGGQKTASDICTRRLRAPGAFPPSSHHLAQLLASSPALSCHNLVPNSLTHKLAVRPIIQFIPAVRLPIVNPAKHLAGARWERQLRILLASACELYSFDMGTQVRFFGRTRNTHPYRITNSVLLPACRLSSIANPTVKLCRFACQ
jgi:hypothetical protein